MAKISAYGRRELFRVENPAGDIRVVTSSGMIIQGTRYQGRISGYKSRGYANLEKFTYPTALASWYESKGFTVSGIPPLMWPTGTLAKAKKRSQAVERAKRPPAGTVPGKPWLTSKPVKSEAVRERALVTAESLTGEAIMGYRTAEEFDAMTTILLSVQRFIFCGKCRTVADTRSAVVVEYPGVKSYTVLCPSCAEASGVLSGRFLPFELSSIHPVLPGVPAPPVVRVLNGADYNWQSK